MHALGLLVAASLSAGAAPPDPWAELAFRQSLLPRPKEVSAYDQLREAGRRESAAWAKLRSKEDWEAYRNPRVEALRRSLGTFPAPPKDLKVKVRKTIDGGDHHIDCLTFESRPGLLVTANLYRPAKAANGMPGISIVHSHHNPKTQGELQDMGVMWARAGCYVLVADQLGHGERRQHPFVTEKDYPGSFRPGRQDYFFRYNLAIQLQTVGDSLMGWMVWDIMRGIDLLLAQPGIDAKKIILLGSVAGGGDPCAVAGALDDRIACVGPFNFGGPQPETRYPLPEDAEERFLYSGSGSWESTRNLARSAKDGFLPWVIVGAIAPRRHIYGHEFEWDRERDPVWKRLEKIHGWYGTKDHLVGVHGAGSVTDSSARSTHCNNIGAAHRKDIHVALKKWFGIDAKEPAKRERRPASELLCLARGESAGKVHEVAGKIADERMAAARERRAKLSVKERAEALRKEWRELLGVGELPKEAKPGKVVPVACSIPDVKAEWMPDEATLLLWPPKSRKPPTVIVAFGQGGPSAFLREREELIMGFIRYNRAVAFVDLGGAGSQRPGGRGRGAASLPSSKLMLGRPVLGGYVERVLGAVAALRARKGLGKRDISLWGDSFVAENRSGARVEVPLDAAQPRIAEPAGALVGLLCALLDEKVGSVEASGGLVGYRSLLSGPFVHVPYDVVVPGALTTGDLVDVAGAIAPRTVWLNRIVDGVNRRMSREEAERTYQQAVKAYREAKAEDRLNLGRLD